jgi:hypothetical protein
VDKVSRPTCTSAGLLAGRVHLAETSGTLVGGDPWVPMSLNGNPHGSCSPGPNKAEAEMRDVQNVVGTHRVVLPVFGGSSRALDSK